MILKGLRDGKFYGLLEKESLATCMSGGGATTFSIVMTTSSSISTLLSSSPCYFALRPCLVARSLRGEAVRGRQSPEDASSITTPAVRFITENKLYELINK
ncbi:hypothetical protein MTR_1g089650 [Medicago truncatula]|nr:hypothetical protein MTR_1g089650 [Medicago truncatula]